MNKIDDQALDYLPHSKKQWAAVLHIISALCDKTVKQNTHSGTLDDIYKAYYPDPDHQPPDPAAARQRLAAVLEEMVQAKFLAKLPVLYIPDVRLVRGLDGGSDGAADGAPARTLRDLAVPLSGAGGELAQSLARDPCIYTRTPTMTTTQLARLHRSVRDHRRLQPKLERDKAPLKQRWARGSREK